MVVEYRKQVANNRNVVPNEGPESLFKTANLVVYI